MSEVKPESDSEYRLRLLKCKGVDSEWTDLIYNQIALGLDEIGKVLNCPRLNSETDPKLLMLRAVHDYPYDDALDLASDCCSLLVLWEEDGSIPVDLIKLAETFISKQE